MIKPELQSSIQEANNAVKDIPSLLETIILTLQGNYGFFIFALALCVVIWYFCCIANPSGYLTYFETRRRSRTERLEKYLSSQHSTETNSTAAIQEIYDSECFEHATGIYAERERRAALIQLHDKIAPSASWRTIMGAREYIDFDQNNCAFVKNATVWTQIHYWINMIIGSIIFFIGEFSMVGLPFTSGNLNLNIFAGFIILVVCIGFSMFFFKQGVPYLSANRLREALSINAG